MRFFRFFSWGKKDTPTVEQTQEVFRNHDSSEWPENVPLTAETLRIASQFHQVWTEGFSIPITDDDDQADWRLAGDDGRSPVATGQRDKLRQDIRDLTYQPNCFRAIKLYCYYLAGNDFSVGLKPKEEKDLSDGQKKLMQDAEQLWKDTLKANLTGFSFDEWMRRTYRDGETFVWLDSRDEQFPPRIRFLDPENVVDSNNDEDAAIVTADDDVATIVGFRFKQDAGDANAKPLKAEEVIFVKLDADTTQKRGISRLFGVRPTAKMLAGTVRNEVILRNLQSSIVLQKKVAGGRGPALGVVDHARTSTTDYPEQSMSREKIRPGSIITTTKGVEVEFKQPANNFADASPLIATLIRQVASITGWTYEQLSADTSQGNLASALSQESPTLQMVKAEMAFHRPHIERLFRYVVTQAIKAGEIEVPEEQLWEDFDVEVRYGDPVSKDPLKEAQRVGNSVLAQIISRAEARRQLGVSSERMEREIKEENESSLYLATANQMGDSGDRAGSQAGNVSAGGANQGKQGEPGDHIDNRNAKGNQ